MMHLKIKICLLTVLCACNLTSYFCKIHNKSNQQTSIQPDTFLLFGSGFNSLSFTLFNDHNATQCKDTKKSRSLPPLCRTTH